MDLTKQKCVPCEGGVACMIPVEIDKYKKLLKLDWKVIDNKKLQREFKFKDFKQAMKFVNKVADIANAEDHHPDIYIFYNIVRIELWTHAINGLFKNDFILASKIEKLV
jgi:4a-hydroxytetrahydrobiopterin dehydratase